MEDIIEEGIITDETGPNPEDAKAVLTPQAKQQLFKAIQILGLRRTKLLQGLDMTLNQLNKGNK